MNPVLSALETAAQGLLYTSESDHPLEPFFWPAESPGEAMKGGSPEPPGSMTEERLRARAGLPSEAPVEKKTLRAFFAPLVEMEDWYGEEERETARRYEALEATLRHHLKDLAVYRAGKTQVDIYVVGRTAEGDFAGFHTRAVET